MQRNYILGIVNQIEKQLCSEERTERVYPASRTKMHLDFIAAVGYTPNEYARRRRLSVALSMLAASERNGTDVAYACGYSSHQALCREIKSILGMTVSEYKKSSVQYFFPPYEDRPVFSIVVMQCVIPETVELIYFSKQLTYIENRAAELFLSHNPAYTGRLFGRNGKQMGTKFSYSLFVENDGKLNTDGFLLSGTREAFMTTAAVASCSNEAPKINAAWDQVYHAWLPVSMYRYAGADSNAFSRQYFEEYLYKSGKSSPYRLKLYMPVVRRDGFPRLTIAQYRAKFLTCTETGSHAERTASERIIRHLTTKYPYAPVRPYELLRISSGGSYTCGMRISNHLLLEDQTFKSLQIDHPCAILEAEEACDPNELGALLERWMRENHITKVQEPFIVYTTEGSSMKMKLICPVNSV